MNVLYFGVVHGASRYWTLFIDSCRWGRRSYTNYRQQPMEPNDNTGCETLMQIYIILLYNISVIYKFKSCSKTLMVYFLSLYLVLSCFCHRAFVIRRFCPLSTYNAFHTDWWAELELPFGTKMAFFTEVKLLNNVNSCKICSLSLTSAARLLF